MFTADLRSTDAHLDKSILYGSTEDYPDQKQPVQTNSDELAALEGMVQRASTELEGWPRVAPTQDDSFDLLGN